MNEKHANKIIALIAREMATCKLHGDEISAIHAAVRDGGAAELLRELRDMAERGGIHARRVFAIARCAEIMCHEMARTTPESDSKKWRELRTKLQNIKWIAHVVACGISPNRAFWQTIDMSECKRHKIRSILRANGLQCIGKASYSWRDYRGIGCVFAPRKQAIRFYTGQRINSDFSRCEYWQ